MKAAILQALPGEIRNRIYEYAAKQSNGIHISTTTKKPAAFQYGTTSLAFALLHTCRMLRAETQQLLFASNRLVVHCASQHGLEFDVQESFRRLAMWCDIVGGKQTCELREITFELQYEGCMVERVIRLLHEEVSNIKSRFHPDAIFNVDFQVPCWDRPGHCIPVHIVLGDRKANLARLQQQPEAVEIPPMDRFSQQVPDTWRMFVHFRLKEAIEIMPEDFEVCKTVSQPKCAEQTGSLGREE